MKYADPMLKHENMELRKENARLQKYIAKLEVKILSEQNAHKAAMAEERKNKVKLVLDKNDANL